MTKKLIAFFIISIWCLALPATAQENGSNAVDDPKGAIEFIQNLSEEVMAVWSDSKLNEKERYEAFRNLFEQATDIELLAKGMLGRHYRTATAEQRSAYMAAMKEYIVAEFDKRMSQIGFKALQITGTKPAPGRRGHLYVKTMVTRDQGDPILADWRVRKENSIFQIVNLNFEGINLLVTNRDVFSAKINDIGFDAFVNWLKEQTSSH